MNNSATTLIKLAVLAGGAVAGALLARWIDDLLTSQTQKRSEYDKGRYEQGLSPTSQQPATEPSRINTVNDTKRRFEDE